MFSLWETEAYPMLRHSNTYALNIPAEISPMLLTGQLNSHGIVAGSGMS